MMHITFKSLMAATTVMVYVFARYANYDPVRAIATGWAIVAPLYLVVWSSWIYPFYISELRDIPTVKGFPLWGQLYACVTEECGIPQRNWHKQYGPIVRFFFLFGSERLSIADDDALKHITIRNPYNYPKRVSARLWMRRILGDGLLLAEGAEHVRQRKNLSPGFSVQSIRALAPVFWEKSLRLARCWREEVFNSSDAETFEVLEWLNRTTLDIIGKVGFGYDFNSLKHPDMPIREAYRLVFAFDLWSRLNHGLQLFFSFTKHFPTQMNRDMETARGIIVQEATEIARQTRSEAERDSGRKDILSLMYAASGKPEGGLSLEMVRDQIMTFIGAGHDSTATGVAWTLHLLSTRPEVQNRLRKEIKEHLPFLFDENTRFDPALVAEADPDQLPYLDNVCRESLRYIPPIPMTVRETAADDTLAGYHIPSGTIICVYSNAINHLPMYWGDDADTFNPDRWADLPETWTNNSFMTFLQGPRGCIGRKFAETEMKILLCCLLSLYEFERDEAVEDPEELKVWRLVLRPRDGMRLRVRLISEAEK